MTTGKTLFGTTALVALVAAAGIAAWAFSHEERDLPRVRRDLHTAAGTLVSYTVALAGEDEEEEERERGSGAREAETEEPPTGVAAVALDASGNAAATWDNRSFEHGAPGVYARRTDAIGRPMSPAVRLSVDPKFRQQNPAVALGPDGAAWFAWESFGQDGRGVGIVARTFSPALEPAGDEVGVNETRDGDQSSPAIAAGADRAVVVWASDADGRGGRIFARALGPSGKPLGPEVPIGAAASRETCPTITALPGSAGYLVAWSRTTERGAEIRARFLAPDGAPRADEFEVSEPDGFTHVEPSVGADASGAFIAAWMTADAEGYGVRARWFGADGRPASAVVDVIGAADGVTHSGVAVARAEGGRDVIAFSSYYPADARERVEAVVFVNGGAAIERDFDVTPEEGNRHLASGSGASRLAAGPQGQVALAWIGDPESGREPGPSLTCILPGPAAAALAARPAPEYDGDEEEEHERGRGLAGAQPHVPPTWDPEWKPQEPLKHLRGGDGPDFGFEGVPGTGWTPPDPEMAVGPGAVVVITNGQIAALDKAGAEIFRDEIEDSFGFWGGQGATNFVFDPEAHYDPQSDRYFAMACERSSSGRSMFLIAVSDDNNPAGTWYKWRKDVTSLAGNDIDSPNMAMDKNALYLTADFFSPTDKYLIYMLPKAPMLSGTDPGAGTSLLITGATQQSMGIPVTYDAGAPAQYIIQSTESTTNTKVTFHAIKNPTGSPTRVTVDLTVPEYRYPDQPAQKGSSQRPFLFEPRFWSCTYRNGSLWAVHHISTPTVSRALVRWYEFDMKGWPDSGSTPVIKQWGEIIPGAGLWAYFPSIGVDSQGNAAITFARSGTAEYIGMWRCLRRWNDPLGTFRAETLVKASTQAHTSGRWGDYSGTKAEPNGPCVLWGHHEWTNSSAWRTWVARYDNYARSDVTKDCKLDVNDFIKFKTLFDTHDPIADWNADGKWDINDWIAYQVSWKKGE